MTALTPAQAGEKVRAAFPFPDYLRDEKMSGQVELVARVMARWLKPGASVLDFGSGPADLAAIASLLGYRVEAADDLNDEWHLKPGNRERIVKFAESFGVKFTILDDAKPWPWAPGSFDMVMLHHVLEHFQNSPRQFLLKLLDCTAPRGVLFITVPSAVNLRKRIAVARGRTNMAPFGAYYWSEGQWRGHSREYVRDDLVQLASLLDLEVLELQSYHYMLHVLPRRAVPLWKAATAVFPGWRDSWYLVARKREGWNPRREPSKADRGAHAQKSWS